MRTTKRQKQAANRANRERVRLELKRKQERAKRNRLLLRIGVTIGVLVLFLGVGFGVYQGTRPSDQTGPANMISGGAVFTAVDGEAQIVETDGAPSGSDPVPTDTSQFDAPANIVTYIDFSCEFCKAFEDGNGKQIEQMVASGDATLEVQPVAILGDYSVRAASAASCMAALQPESFFTMLTTMYQNQPTEGGPGYTNQEILDLWSNAGIDPSSDLSECVKDDRYADWIQTRTDAVTSDPKLANPSSGGFGTPTVLVNDVRYQPTGPQGLSDPKEFAAFVADNSRGAGKGENTESPSPSP
ncbi:hypothetical protein GCM10027062_14220 [Nocardioides hungaricus]